MPRRPRTRTASRCSSFRVNDFVIRALALALQRVPAANAVWAGDRILRFKHSDIGIAVALDGGLITPIIRNAETKSLSAISAEMKDLAARARDKKLKPSEYQGGSSAISNLGMHQVREFTAIINPPHATILAVGAARRQAVEKARRRRRLSSACSASRWVAIIAWSTARLAPSFWPPSKLFSKCR